MHEMWNVTYAKTDLMFLGVEKRDFKKKKGLKKTVNEFESFMPKDTWNLLL